VRQQESLALGGGGEDGGDFGKRELLISQFSFPFDILCTFIHLPGFLFITGNARMKQTDNKPIQLRIRLIPY
jgi:hypothetical protein